MPSHISSIRASRSLTLRVRIYSMATLMDSFSFGKSVSARRFTLNCLADKDGSGFARRSNEPFCSILHRQLLEPCLKCSWSEKELDYVPLVWLQPIELNRRHRTKIQPINMSRSHKLLLELLVVCDRA